MAKKVAAKFVATIELNPEKAGGWLAIVSVQKEAGTSINSIQPAEGVSEYSSWKNASGKPTAMSGVLEYKVDA